MTIILLVVLFCLVGCNADNDALSLSNNEHDRLVEVNFQPNLENGNQGLSLQDIQDEINSNNVHFYIFEKDGATYKFRYSPEKHTIKATGPGSIAFPFPEKNYEDLKLLISVNHKGDKPQYGESITEFRESRTLSLDGQLSSSNLPMSGEADLIFDQASSRFSSNVVLMHAVAKIQLSIKDNQDKAIQFKSISSVRLYRSLDQIAVFYDPANVTNNHVATKPTIPAGSKYLLGSGSSSASIMDATSDPIIYEAGDVKNFSIVIPEARLLTNPSLSNSLFLVVGLKTDAKDEEVFYRVDLAKYTEASPIPTDFLPVLRNKVFDFSLIGAASPGTDTPEESISESSSIYLNVKDWEIDNMSWTLQTVTPQDYHFNMNTSFVDLEKEAASTFEIPFATDIDFNTYPEAVKTYWLSEVDGTSEGSVDSEHFDVSINKEAKTITITTKNFNDTGKSIREVMVIQVFNQLYRIPITQYTVVSDYVLKEIISVNGKYYADKDLVSGQHTITVRLSAREEGVSLEGEYRLHADDVDGIFIDASGSFDNVQSNKGIDYQDVTVDIQGRPDSPRDKMLYLTAYGVKESSSTVTITLAHAKKVILGLFGQASKYKLSGLDDFSKLIAAPNFGSTPESIVQSEEIEYIECIDSQPLLSQIEKYNPDVIIYGDGYVGRSLTDTHSTLVDYVSESNKYGGRNALIIMNREPKVRDDIFKSLDILSHEPGYKQQGILSLKADFTNKYYRIDLPKEIELFATQHASVRDWMRVEAYDDPISRGSFLDFTRNYIRFHQEDVAFHDTDFDQSLIFKYSGNLKFSAVETHWLWPDKRLGDFGTSSFRAVKYPVVWIGSSAFLHMEDQWSFDESGKIELSLRGVFRSDKDKYYFLKRGSNAMFFANVLEWAFIVSEQGLNYK